MKFSSFHGSGKLQGENKLRNVVLLIVFLLSKPTLSFEDLIQGSRQKNLIAFHRWENEKESVSKKDEWLQRKRRKEKK